MPRVLEFTSNKVICCIRNPLDIIVSYAKLCNTLSHSVEPNYSIQTEYKEWWEWWVKEQA
jgi:hypothetical protein